MVTDISDQLDDTITSIQGNLDTIKWFRRNYPDFGGGEIIDGVSFERVSIQTNPSLPNYTLILDRCDGSCETIRLSRDEVLFLFPPEISELSCEELQENLEKSEIECVVMNLKTMRLFRKFLSSYNISKSISIASNDSLRDGEVTLGTSEGSKRLLVHFPEAPLSVEEFFDYILMSNHDIVEIRMSGETMMYFRKYHRERLNLIDQQIFLHLAKLIPDRNIPEGEVEISRQSCSSRERFSLLISSP